MLNKISSYSIISKKEALAQVPKAYKPNHPLANGIKIANSLLVKNNLNNPTKRSTFQSNYLSKYLLPDYLDLPKQNEFLMPHQRYCFISLDTVNHMHNGLITSSNK